VGAVEISTLPLQFLSVVGL